MTRRSGRIVMPRMDDRGSATIWLLSFCLVVWVGGLAGVAVGAATVARHRAESAADLAALAGAAAAVRGAGDPCQRAGRVSRAAGGELVGCRVTEDGSVLVVVEVTAPRVLARLPGMPPARARARAGGGWSLGGG